MKMILYVFIALAVFYSFGAWAFHRVLKDKPPAEKRSGWMKYWVYLLIIIAISSGLFFLPAFFTPLAVVVVLIGYYEVVKAWWKKPAAPGNWLFLVMTLVLYTIIAAGFLIFAGQPAGLLIVTFLTTISFDGFSQLTGQLIGRHKIVPGISPKKTLEGFAGGLILGILTTLCLRSYLEMNAPESLLLGLLITVTAFAGDILASWYKRKCAIKDFSNLLPGHGGVLDRFDSLVFSGAVIGFIYQYTELFR